MSMLTSSQRRFWEENGYLLMKGYFDPHRKQALTEWVRDLEARPETPGKWMKYFESASDDSRRLLCRVENFVPYHDGMRDLLCGQEMLEIMGELMGEEAVLFKEKINFKLPGGKRFRAPPGRPAFITFGQKYHITLMVGVDAATPENGCLEIVPGSIRKASFRRRPHDDRPGFRAPPALEHLPTEAGDVLLFDSYIPHRSGPT